MRNNFSWTSSLGISAALFITIAVIYMLIGTLGLIIIKTNATGRTGKQFYLSKEVDTKVFGKTRSELIQQSPEFAKYITMLMYVFCSFMVGMGILQYGVARFALTEGQNWAYWVSVLSNVFMLLIYWLMVILPVLQEYKVGYFALWHPYALIPSILLPIATILGWIGLNK
ncbi:MAG: hypothetical protein KG003_02750 [Bacteroidetes bacterium]|nr:hypothetical protein [Bacteroidota bacterium]